MIIYYSISSHLISMIKFYNSTTGNLFNIIKIELFLILHGNTSSF